MFDLANKIQSNGTEAYKFATTTFRVYVNENELENLMENGYEDFGEKVEHPTREQAFEYLANEEILKMYRSDANVKMYEIDLA